MTTSDSAIRAEALARTDDGGPYADPWDAVQDYRAATRYATKHPNKGSYALSQALDLPRGRLRGWIDDGSAPDAARAVETALE
ncbi:hypothetical protein CV102_13240 [Natronococcus pandeyae]|uniref:Uncharacterized protein n=1 Tax=Natronococcus pandeyae TaxID=2055836 RepID=A0A8J8Q3A8_9EURY|nr:hypothetical protein [Natronococcus pandeyae]TYL38164.1 hypothetical protein CV102_13240 [Natronococcus pandeyae]